MIFRSIALVSAAIVVVWVAWALFPYVLLVPIAGLAAISVMLANELKHR